MGIISLVLAIISIILVFILPILGIVLAIVSLILGIIEVLKRKREGNKKVLPIVSIVLSSIVIVFIVFFVIVYTVLYVSNPNFNNANVSLLSKNSYKSIFGTWYDSANKTNLVLNSNNEFEMYTDDKTTLYIKGSFSMVKDDDDDFFDEYIVTMSATSRIINGKQYTSSYTTQFSIATEDYKSMIMMNTISYNMYNFEKVK